MTETLPPPLTFEALRQAGISHAQEASADLWTDYNLHDPGVTLLEQTCYALTELAYRSDLPLRDLLTGADGVLNFDELGLFSATAVLRSAPVTRSDLETCLGSLPQAARVRLSETGRQGLLNAQVIPQTGFSDAEAVAAVAETFAACRPLCTDLADKIETARPVRARLGGRIVVGRRALPERVAAEVWLRVELILRGTPLGERPDTAARGATRADVAEEPMLFEGIPPLQGTPGRSAHIAALRLVPDLEEVQSLDLTTEAGELLPDFRPPDADSYLALLPPEGDGTLSVVQDGALVLLDPARLAHEIDRLRAEFLAAEANRLDPTDWSAPRSGEPRRFDHISVNATLPGIYVFRPISPEARQLAGYRSLIDALLGGMTSDLDQLPGLFSADGAQTVSHWPHLPQLGRDAGLIQSSDDWSATFARHDHWHHRRGQVLDLLIALQGEAMPTEGRSEIERDRPVSEQATAALQRRARFLHALPDINRRRGTGPNGSDPGGVLMKFLCLADLPINSPQAVVAAKTAAGITFVADMPAGEISRDAIALPEDTLDMLLPDRAALAMEARILRNAMPWFAEGSLTTAAFARAPLAESWLVVSKGPEVWQILFDSGNGSLHDAGLAPSRDAAVDRANRLRASFAAVGRACEGAWLVEDIRLRGQTGQFTPHVAQMVLPGWSLRTSSPAYRRHVVRMIDRVAPAHCRIRPLWLGPHAFAMFAAAWDAWQADGSAGPALAAVLAAGDAPE